MSLRRFTLYEHRAQPLLPLHLFLRRVFLHAAVSFLTVAVSLGIGIVGYHATEGLGWLDSLLNASMILGGMGPVDVLHTVAGKWFASFYSLFSGMIFLVAAGVLFAPLAHRALHWIHLDEEARAAGEDAAG
jgi:hypothetical protein